MATTVAPQELKKFAPVSRRFITLARVVGWDVRWTNSKRQSVALRSPESGKSLIIPSTNVNANRSMSWIRTLVRHTPEKQLEDLYSGTLDLTKDPDAASIVASFGLDFKKLAEEMGKNISGLNGDKLSPSQEETVPPKVADTVVMESPVDVKYEAQGEFGDWWVRIHPGGEQQYVCKQHDPEYVAPKGLASMPGHNRHHMPGAREHLDNIRGKAVEARKAQASKAKQEVPAAPPAPPATPATAASDVVARRPWLARETHDGRGGGYMYESPYVDVLTLADGTETYECRQCRNWRNENPRSVAGHSSRRHGVINGERKVVTTDKYEASGITRSQTPQKRLANEIVSALDTVQGWREMDPLELALTVADVMVEARPERPPVVPLDDAQVLARIMSLLDRGQTAALNQQMEALAERLRQSEETAADAARRAARAESNLSALRDLLNETREE